MDEVYDVRAAMAPKSDQINADDLIGGPATVTITGINLSKVTGQKGEQPLSVIIDGGFKPWKPCKSMMRVLSSEWGTNAAKWIGRSVTLYRDPSVKFGGDQVGGIRISHMSHINKRLTLSLTVTRGNRAPYTVEPLQRPASAPTGTAATPYAAFTATLAAKGIKAADLSEWWAIDHPDHDLTKWAARDLDLLTADLLADGSPLLASFRSSPFGGAS
jgi:hypothetical protein